MQKIVPKFTAKEIFARGRTHGRVRSSQPQDACNLTESRRAIHLSPGSSRLHVAKRAVECNVAKKPHQRSPCLHSPCLAPATLAATSVLAAVLLANTTLMLWMAVSPGDIGHHRPAATSLCIGIHCAGRTCWFFCESDITHANDFHF